MGERRVVSSAYSASGCKWPKKDLNYFHQTFNPNLPKEQIKATFKSACQAWEKVCGLRFNEVTSLSQADIKVGWEQIDGAGGTLAYAYLPGNCGGSLAGTMRFDLGDKWTIGDGKSLWQTSVHELGHIIGFYHSDRTDSIMWPYSGGGGTVISKDDAAGAVALYGPPRGANPGPGPVPPKPVATELAIVTTAMGEGTIVSSDDSRAYVLSAENINKWKAAGAKSVKVRLQTIGSGDLDCYSRWGKPPVVMGDLDSSDVYDHGSWTPGGAEAYVVKLDKSEALYFLVHAYQSGGQFQLFVSPEA
jgi:hypothetical protein